MIDGVSAATGGRPLDRSLPLLVFVHGAGMDRTVWQLTTRWFAGHGYSVLAVDLPGHGAAPGPAADSIGGYRSWLVDVIDRSGFGSAHLVGHSMGAFVVLATAATRPELTRSLTMLGVGARMPVHRDLLDAAKREDHLAFELVTSWSHSRRAHAGGHPTPGVWMMGATLRLLERGVPGVLYNDLAACDAYEGAVEAAAKVSCETLFLLAAEDVMVRPAAAAPLISATQWSRMVTIPATGHLSMVERPDAVIDAIAGFLAGVGRPGG